MTVKCMNFSFIFLPLILQPSRLKGFVEHLNIISKKSLIFNAYPNMIYRLMKELNRWTYL